MVHALNNCYDNFKTYPQKKLMGISFFECRFHIDLCLQLICTAVLIIMIHLVEFNLYFESIHARKIGLIFLQIQYNDHIFVAINGDGTEKEQFLLHKIFILQRMIAFLFGPNPEG